MIILNIQKNKLYLSNEEIIDISPLIKANYNLKKGDNIKDLYDEICYDASFEKGLFLLSLRDRTKKELKLKLKEKYKNIKMIEKSLNKLEKMGYINDLEYCKNYIKSKKYGKSRISYNLYLKGVDRETIDLAYEDLEEEFEEKSFEEQKLEKLIVKNIKKEEQKLIQYLMRQGFQYSLIRDKLREYKENDYSFD